MQKLTVKFIRENVVGADSVSHKNGVFTVRHEFFYAHGKTADDFANSVKLQLQSPKLEIQIVDCGCEYKAFRGGAGVAQNSHWWVKFSAKEITL